MRRIHTRHWTGRSTERSATRRRPARPVAAAGEQSVAGSPILASALGPTRRVPARGSVGPGRAGSRIGRRAEATSAARSSSVATTSPGRRFQRGCRPVRPNARRTTNSLDQGPNPEKRESPTTTPGREAPRVLGVERTAASDSVRPEASMATPSRARRLHRSSGPPPACLLGPAVPAGRTRGHPTRGGRSVAAGAAAAGPQNGLSD